MTSTLRSRSIPAAWWWLPALLLTACASPSPVVPSANSGPVAGHSASIAATPAPPAPTGDEVGRGPSDQIDSTDVSAGYGMLYMPSAGQGVQLVTDMALNRLYEETLPGYGLYTFVLLGAGFERASGDELVRHSELFRMIETYVATSGGEDGPSAGAHVFLVPIRAGRSPTAPLMDLVAADLSDLMRRQLGERLRQQGQARLANRIERGAGPFLVTGLEPSLLPLDAEAPRLVADLSSLGPEHLYGLVDAYDRDIPPESSGRPESLSALRQRLLELPLKPGTGAAKQGADDKRWIFRI